MKNAVVSRINELVERIKPDLSALWCPNLDGDAGAIDTSNQFMFQDPSGPTLTQLDIVHSGLRTTFLVAQTGIPINERLEYLVDLLEDAVKQDPDEALAYLFLRNTADYPLLHVIHCAVITTLVARAYGMEQEDRRPLLCAALTQNISMCALQAQLYSHAGDLARLDRLMIRRHPMTSVGILKALGIEDPQWMAPVALHHERMDGSGYPFGLKGEDIPLPARLIGAVDIYCAAVSPRAYRAPRLAHEVMRDLFMGAGRVVDDVLARSLVKALGIYPPGTVVELRNGKLALVVERGSRVDRPLVTLLYEKDSQLLPAEGQHAAVRVVATDQLPTDFDLEGLWQAVRKQRQPKRLTA